MQHPTLKTLSTSQACSIASETAYKVSHHGDQTDVQKKALHWRPSLDSCFSQQIDQTQGCARQPDGCLLPDSVNASIIIPILFTLLVLSDINSNFFGQCSAQSGLSILGFSPEESGG